MSTSRTVRPSDRPLAMAVRCSTATAAALLLAAPALVAAPARSPAPPAQAAPASIEVRPEALELRVGESVQLDVTVRDAAGNPVEADVVFLPVYGQFWNLEQRTWGFNLFDVSGEGLVTASKPGEYGVIVRVAGAPGPQRGEGELLQVEVPLRILRPDVERVELAGLSGRLYEGTVVPVAPRVVDTAGDARSDLPVEYESSDPSVARVDGAGHLRLVATGRAEIVARTGGVTGRRTVEVVENPAVSLSLELDRDAARTGEVVHLSATPRDAAGDPVADLPVRYSFSAAVDPLARGGPSSGTIAQDGRFVADLPGTYTLVASAGSLADTAVLVVEPRGVEKRIELVGHARIQDRGTSDLWVWKAPDGRDYAITGTHSAEGHAYVWDVTEPANMVMIDTVRVDARTVNDVKVSEDGRVAVMSREGASNRRNGIVILDVSEPSSGVKVLARFDDELTGGVHNTFIHDRHVYALSGGQRYDIISIEDPTNPRRVGRFELPNPDRSIHDVWVVDGVAYSANWNDGVVAVDVGGGGRGGSPADPVLLGTYPFPTGWNHAVVPYRSRSSGKHYVFAGDEAARTGSFSPRPEVGSGTPGYEGEPDRWRGWIHVLEWDPASPEDEPLLVARYEVPEAGSHNIWVEDDVMYVAFYNGGLRVVDVSGELMGDLYRQGREIAYFLPFDPEGFVPNAPQVWGAQPHEGTIFFSDYNSGLWAVRLVDEAGDER